MCYAQIKKKLTLWDTLDSFCFPNQWRKTSLFKFTLRIDFKWFVLLNGVMLDLHSTFFHTIDANLWYSISSVNEKDSILLLHVYLIIHLYLVLSDVVLICSSAAIFSFFVFSIIYIIYSQISIRWLLTLDTFCLYLFVLMAMFDIETSHVDNFTDNARSLMAPTISWGLFLIADHSYIHENN